MRPCDGATVTKFSAAFFLLALFSAGFAKESEKVIWHRSYFVSVGLDVIFSAGGDLDGKGLYKADGDDGNAGERVYVPSIGTFPLPLFEAGVNFNQHTIAVSFGLWNPDVNYANGTDDYTGNDANFWRFSAEYRYYFFWKEDFQVGPGIGYSFSRLSVKDAAFGTDKYGSEYREEAVYSGNAFAVSANMRYKMYPFGMDVAFRYRPIFFRSVSTDTGGYSDLSETLWEHTFEFSGKVFVEF